MWLWRSWRPRGCEPHNGYGCGGHRGGGWRIATSPKEVLREYEGAFSREVVKHPGKEWEWRVREACDRWERERDGMDEPLPQRLLVKAWSGLRGVPAEDGIEKAMLRAEGVEGMVREWAFRYARHCWRVEEVPDQWVRELFVAVYKRGNPAVIRNFRPVTLLSMLSRFFRKVWVGAAQADLEGKGGVSPANFGFVKGRDRFMVVVLLLGTQAHREWLGLSDLWLLCMDVEGAFTRMWREGAAWKMRQAGLSPKLWRLMRALERGSRGRVWVEGLRGEMRELPGGGAQGAPETPMKWQRFLDDLPEEMAKVGGGWSWGGRR